MLWVVLTETKLETLWQVNKAVTTQQAVITQLLPKETAPRLPIFLPTKKKEKRKIRFGHGRF